MKDDRKLPKQKLKPVPKKSKKELSDISYKESRDSVFEGLRNLK